MNWDAKVSFWSNLIVSSCRDLHQASVLGRELESRFIRNSLKPSSLGRIVLEMCRAGHIQKLGDWERQCQSTETWTEWTTALAVRSVSWAVKSVLGDDHGSPNMEEVYVIPRLVEV